MTDHQTRYTDQANAYVRERRENLDRNWRAFLWLATVRPSIWERVESSVNLERATVDWPSIIDGHYWSSGESLILRLAQVLYTNDGEVSITDLTALDEDLWAAVLKALEFYRGAK